MSALTTLESRLADAWQDIKTDARADLETALADAKAELAQAKTDAEQLKATVIGQVQPLLTQFEGAVKVAVEAAEPGVQANVTKLVETLLGDVAKVAL